MFGNLGTNLSDTIFVQPLPTHPMFACISVLRSLLLCIALLLCSYWATAGLPAHRNYTEADGLASAHVYCVLQDRNGFIWVSTEAGVSRFDGYEFTNYSLADGLADTEIFSLHEDSQGRIWHLGANGRVSYYLDGQIFNSNTDTTLKALDLDAFYLCMLEDSKGNIWFGNQAYGAACYTVDHKVRSYLGSANWRWSATYGIFEDDDGRIWAHVPMGRLDLSGQAAVELPEGALYGVTRHAVWQQRAGSQHWEEQQYMLEDGEYPVHMVLDTTQRLWMCTSRGLKLFESSEVSRQVGGRYI